MQYEQQAPSGYLTIGRFAELAGISRQTLIYYDRIGLFSPKYSAPNGYRYYTYDQLDLLWVILMFRELDISINQIKTYIQDLNPKDAIRMLSQCHDSVEARLKRLESAKDMLRLRLNDIHQGLKQDVTSIADRIMPQRPIFRGKAVDKDRRAIEDDEWTAFYLDYKENHLISGYPEGFIVCRDYLFSDNPPTIHAIICHVGSAGYANAYIPAGRYVTAWGPGSFDDVGPIYARLADYIRSHQLKVVGAAYEKRLIDDVATGESAKQRMEVCINVL